MDSFLRELKECCEKVGFSFEVARKEVEEAIGNLKVLDYYVTTEVPLEFFEGTLMDSCILTNKALLGYEVKRGNTSLLHVLPLDKINMTAEEIKEEKGEVYVIVHFFGGWVSLATSAKYCNREKLRKFHMKVSSHILSGDIHEQG